ncbi:MAG TPA: FAD-dependent monooxygenase [Hyphomicrobiaceae bacterium]|jgi:2-octaprenyl-6-methoxyphenol hydroxylase
MTDFEAAVIGAGPAGLATALALARMGVETALVAPPHDPARAAQDQRTTALIGPSLRLLENLGVWDVGWVNAGASRRQTQQALLGLAPLDPTYGFAAPIAAVRIADDRGGLVRAPEILFRAAEIGLASFGANLPNPALLGALTDAAAHAPGLARVETAGVVGIAPQAGSVRLALAEGGSVEAALAVAADGRASQAPAAAGIAVSAWDYPQAAVVASFAHSRPHAATVNELHRRAGPLTTVPLQGLRSALVWVEEPAEARRLAALAEAAFAAELEERLQGVLGRIGQVGPRAVHALAGRRAERMAAARIALVGEAAHVVPPIGAQGLNLGLRDAAELADCLGGAKARGEDIGGEVVLAAYDSARRRDVLARSLSIDILNRSLLTDLLPVEALRGLAAHAIAGFAPLRRALMQEGAGLAGPLPSLMR